MTETEAKRELRRHLVFADERQIQAIRLLDSIAACVDAIKENPECENCEGLGEFYQPCGDCNGQGCDGCTDGEILDDCLICNGLGFFIVDWPDFAVGIIRSAKNRIIRERQKEFSMGTA